ncbi:MAG: hypothetical protein GY850_47600 [bacterium]|nr:hypothetical protein [bacterium]
MNENMLLVAIGCSRLPGIFDIAASHPFVVFGTMDENVLSDLAQCVEPHRAANVPTYFYETG